MSNQYLLPNHDQLVRRRIDELGLNDFRTAIIASAYSAYELVGTQQSDTPSIGTTRFGGHPDLPRDFDASQLESFEFAYQVNCADLPNGHQLGLPSQGILSVYSDSEPLEGGKSLYFPVSELVRHTMSDPIPDNIFSDVKPWRIEIASNVGFASYGDELVDEIEDAGLEDEYEKLCDTQFNAQAGPRFGEILGRFADLNGDMRNDAAKNCGGIPSEWRSLWKIFSSHESNLVISDFHLIHGMIRESHLEQLDFANTYTVTSNG